MNAQAENVQGNSLLKVLRNKNTFHFNDHNMLILPLMGRFELIKFENIIYCCADSSYVHVFTIDGRKITLAKTLKWVQAQLNQFFLRTHQSYLINLRLVQRYNLQDASLELEGGVQIPVARSMKKEVGQYFKC